MALPLYDPEKLPKERGWFVESVFQPLAFSPAYVSTLSEMSRDPEAPGHSDVGVRNLLFSLILSLRPQAALEVGGHIGLATLVMGEALRINGYGLLYTIEPQDHYYE